MRSRRRRRRIAIGVPLEAIVRGLEAFRPVAGRLAALRSHAGAAVIDDTYNANPDSVLAAIDVLAAAPVAALARARRHG
jgi:UDP-N-acetylmuramoyl-tripeptide--D-alanyl-D-alanine ligase